MIWWPSINGRSPKAFTLQNDVVTAYRNYEFHDIYQKVHNFCVVELGGFYLDIIKDRLYTTGAASAPRRSAQTAMYHVAQAMVRWLAPILSFTAEEVWGFLPGEHDESVFLNTWHQFPARRRARARPIDWDALIALKADVARDLERLRAAGEIGAPLEAEVTVFAPAAQAGALLGAARRAAFFADHQPGAGGRNRHASRFDGADQRTRACGSRSNPAASPNACAAGICAATSAAIRGTRNFARAASSTSRVPVRSVNSHDH